MLTGAKKFGFTWLVAIAAGCLSFGCDNLRSCTDLRNHYADGLRQLCAQQDASNGPGDSKFCSVCVAANLYDYRTSANGQCVCTQLVLPVDNCASTFDDQALLAGIKGAGMECVSFSIGPDTSLDGGSIDDGGTDASSMIEAGTGIDGP